MARTIEEINTELCERFVNNPLIQQAYSIIPGSTFEATFSKLSLESVLFHCIAVSIYTLEVLFDNHKDWVEARALELKWGSLSWYVSTVKQFQYGDSLVFQDNVYQYASIDPSIQIVKLAAASLSGNQILLKVASEDQNGNAIALSTPELDAVRAYVKKIKPPGIKVNTVSRDPDLLMIHYHVYADALVINSDGSLISDPNVFPIHDAINSYIRNLPFNGIFSITELTDLIQQSQGTLNPVFESVQTKYGTNNYTTFVDYYTPNAGYLQVDPLYQLSNTITIILQ